MRLAVETGTIFGGSLPILGSATLTQAPIKAINEVVMAMITGVLLYQGKLSSIGLLVRGSTESCGASDIIYSSLPLSIVDKIGSLVQRLAKRLICLRRSGRKTAVENR